MFDVEAGIHFMDLISWLFFIFILKSMLEAFLFSFCGFKRRQYVEYSTVVYMLKEVGEF